VANVHSKWVRYIAMLKMLKRRRGRGQANRGWGGGESR